MAFISGTETTAIPNFAGITGCRATRSEGGELLAYNRGEHDRGFALCSRCGFSDSERKAGDGRQDLPKGFEKHAQLWSDRFRPCWEPGDAPVIRNLRLAAIHVTDLVQLKFSEGIGSGLSPEFITTLGHALKLAGAEMLELDHRELGVVFGPVGSNARLGIQLFDNAAGGAGHVLELAAMAEQWFRKAREVMFRDEQHHATCATACLRCLLTSASQADFEAGSLQRRVAYDILTRLLHGVEVPPESKAVGPQPRARGSAVERAAAFKRRGKAEAQPHLVTEAEACDPCAHQILRACDRNAWPKPEIGYEVSDKAGAIIGLAELAWPSHRLALVTPRQSEFSASLASEGWTVLVLPVTPEELGALFS